MIWNMFWNINRIYFLFFSVQNFKSNWQIIFLKFIPIIFFWYKIYSFPLKFTHRRFNFCYSLWDLFLFLHDLTQLLQQIEKIVIFFIFFICYYFLSFFIYSCFFVFYLIRRISIWSTMIPIYFITFIIQ